MSVKFSLVTNTKMAAMLKKGPNGMMFSLSENNMTKEIGNAINVAIKILHMAIGNPITRPNKNISLNPDPS